MAERHTHPPLEREPELEKLADAGTGAMAGEGGVILIEGSAGIGKTLLMTQAQEAARARGMRVLAARGSELEREFSYGVVRQLFEPMIRAGGEEERSALLAGPAGLCRPVFEPEEGQTTGPDSPAATLHGLHWLAVHASDQAPLLLAVDDLHWADRPSARFLEYLGRRLEGLPVLVVTAFRPAEPGAETLLLGSLPPESTTRLPLRPLSEDGSAELVRRELSAQADAGFCRACHSASAGNPLLLRELTEELAREGVTPSDKHAQAIVELGPKAVTRTVQVRLSGVPSAVSRFAAAATVLGDRSPPLQVARLAELDSEAADDAIETLRRLDILRSGPRVEFVHPLVRTAIYEELGPGRRERAHAQAAGLLAEADAPAEEISVHLLAAEPAGLAWVVDALAEDAAEALRKGDPGGAAVLLERALAEPPSSERIVEVERALGRAKALAGDADAFEHLRAALLAGPGGSVRAEIASELARALVPVGRFDEAVETLEAAIEQLDEADRELALRLEADISMVGRLHPSIHTRTGSRVELVAEGIAGATPAERVVLASLACERAMAGRAASDVVEVVEQVWEGGLLPEVTSASPTLYDAVFAAVVAEPYPLADRVCDDSLADARSRGSLLGVTGSLCFRAQLALRRGAVAEAEADARAAGEAAAIGGYAFGPMALAALLEALRERGELDAARAALEEAVGSAELPENIMATFLLQARARLWIGRGEVERGIADLRELERRAEAMGARNPSAFAWRSDLATALIAKGRTEDPRSLAELGEEPERARALVDEEVELARRWGAPRALGAALRARGLVAGGEEGLSALREAVTVLEPSPAQLEAARALTDLGAALRRAGRRKDAREPLRRSMDLAHRCGAAPLAERARTELRATGARPRSLVVTGVDSLTPSERRVATMATDGLTNRELAQQLFVTQKTIEAHMRSIFRKLEIGSRSELPEALEGASSAKD